MNRKLFKAKILTIITAIALFVGIGVVYGFTSSKEVNQLKKHKTAFQTWYFTGNDITEVKTDSLYSPMPPGAGVCGSGLDLPCQIQFDETDYSTPGATPLQNYLNAHDSSYVLNHAISTKEEAP